MGTTGESAALIQEVIGLHRMRAKAGGLAAVENAAADAALERYVIVAALQLQHIPVNRTVAAPDVGGKADDLHVFRVLQEELGQLAPRRASLQQGVPGGDAAFTADAGGNGDFLRAVHRYHPLVDVAIVVVEQAVGGVVLEPRRRAVEPVVMVVEHDVPAAAVHHGAVGAAADIAGLNHAVPAVLEIGHVAAVVHAANHGVYHAVLRIGQVNHVGDAVDHVAVALHAVEEAVFQRIALDEIFQLVLARIDDVAVQEAGRL